MGLFGLPSQGYSGLLRRNFFTTGNFYIETLSFSLKCKKITKSDSFVVFLAFKSRISLREQVSIDTNFYIA